MKTTSAVCFFKKISKWLLISLLLGVTLGAAGGALGSLIDFANSLRGKYPWLLFLLPAIGLLIVLFYRLLKEHDSGMDGVLSDVREGKPISARIAPLVFVSTVLTHLGGGSVGREGAALQMGGSVGGIFARLFRLDAKECRIATMCGMAAAFSGAFGTPLTATVFVLEITNAGSAAAVALIPCMASSLTAVFISSLIGLAPVSFDLICAIDFNFMGIIRVAVIAAAAALLGIVFCIAIRFSHKFYERLFNNPYLRIAIGGAAVVLLSVVLKTNDYNGAGSAVLSAALAGEALPYAFLLKIIFTALTLGAGYKGGEIVPVFFTGATFGCVAAPLIGLPAALGAAVGMVALFCAATKAPLASVLLAAELFGGRCIPLFAVACAVSYVLSGKFSLYNENKSV